MIFDQEYDQEVRERVDELKRVFDPPYETMVSLIFDSHEPGECVQCDAYRRMAKERTDRP